jgi:hypothetical protein
LPFYACLGIELETFPGYDKNSGAKEIIMKRFKS